MSSPRSGSRPTLAAENSDDLLPKIAAGDPTAFARWLGTAEGRLRDSLRSFAARVDTEAVVQEALLRFAITIARNLAVSELRRNHRLETVEVETLEAMARRHELNPPPYRPPDPALRQAIEHCRARLPARPAAALDARLRSGGAEPDRTLAEGVGMKVNTFAQNLNRARRFLVDCLRQRGIDVHAEMS